MVDLDMHGGDVAAELPRSLVRTRSFLLLGLFVLIVAETGFPIATWPEHLISAAFYLYKLGWLAVLVLLIAFSVALFRYARDAGGAGYARRHVLFSIAPFGLLVIPELVRCDIASGYAAWSMRNAPSDSERALRTALYIVALAVVAPPLYFVHHELLYLTPVLAFLLQRLVLPWFRRADPPEPSDITA